MKQKIGIFLLVWLYMIAMLRPIAPFVEYAINYDYISKVLCINKDKPELECNGKCHLMKELKKQQEDDFKSLRISMEEYPVGFISLLSLINTKTLENYTSNNSFFYSDNYSYLDVKSVFHPPNFSF
ncbi:hypothetical protein [Tenacibaculum sp. IB213877]|uniref:hypothetical protein n=1 Tax=Tenacibaculum sp. IB213877 TaxID=3097351 RepID=UPI002A598537|nr:hypothetical protein [Tenacibaculum sp. IB213877]MDY0780521.1 hypothetical protein [Tenacibaculum sp. IB213877]